MKPLFHSVCPICKGELNHKVILHNESWFGKKLNLKYYSCSKDDFIQITDLYNSLFLQSVSFSKNLSLCIDYVNHESIIWLKGDAIYLKNRLIYLDYPSLQEAKKKVQTFVLFS